MSTRSSRQADGVTESYERINKTLSDNVFRWERRLVDCGKIKVSKWVKTGEVAIYSDEEEIDESLTPAIAEVDDKTKDFNDADNDVEMEDEDVVAERNDSEEDAEDNIIEKEAEKFAETHAI
jgi:hypothetical protein